MSTGHPPRRRPLPGFGLSLGCTLAGLGVGVLLPLAALGARAAGGSTTALRAAVTDPRVLASLRLSFLASLGAATLNLGAGLLVAWVLTRYRFPGRRVADALVDLPFALPTAVAGLALAQLYGPGGWVGRRLPLKVAYTPLGVGLALAFVGLPFVVRSVQPVLEGLDPQDEEAAACLGAGRLQILRRVLLPQLGPALFSGFALAFARGLGEYGSVVFISGNLPFRTEITPLLIMTRLEQYDFQGASALAVVMLAASFALLLPINALRRRASRRARHA